MAAAELKITPKPIKENNVRIDQEGAADPKTDNQLSSGK
jgi:hypothetical protein